MLDLKLRRMMRKTFETPEGMITLQAILIDLGYFSDPEKMDPEEVGRRNYASRLMAYLGLTDQKYVGDSMKPYFVKALFEKLPFPVEEKKDAS